MRVGSYQYNSCLAYRVTARASHRPLYGLAGMFLLRPRCVFSFGSLAQQICARFRVLMLLHCLLLLLLWLPVASGMLHHSSRGRRKPKDKAKELQPGKSLKGFAALNMSLCVCVCLSNLFTCTQYTQTQIRMQLQQMHLQIRPGLTTGIMQIERGERRLWKEQFCAQRAQGEPELESTQLISSRKLGPSSIKRKPKEKSRRRSA